MVSKSIGAIVAIGAVVSLGLVASGCTANGDESKPTAKPSPYDSSGEHPGVALDEAPFAVVEVADFERPWAMTFLPQAKEGQPLAALITLKTGKLLLWRERSRERVEVAGVPEVAYGGQGGLGDVILAPDYADSGRIYLSWARASGSNRYGAVVAHAKLDLSNPDEPQLHDLQEIWSQSPQVSGQGHYSHRLAFSPDGQYLFISSGERQKFDPSQDMSGNLGKIIRLHADGSLPEDNPFAAQGGVAAQIWTLGNRNPLGLAFDGAGRLWEHEMGPLGGDEVNLIQPGVNYGYPTVSNGDHYNGDDIPDHHTRPEFRAPLLWWNPSISPAGLVWYSGGRYAGWDNSLLLGGLTGESLIRVALDGERAYKADRWYVERRIREVEIDHAGYIWLLSDGPNGALLKLEPRNVSKQPTAE